MALVVHDPFDLDGKIRKRGDVLFGDEADAVTRDAEKARRCTAVADAPFEHLRPKPSEILLPGPGVKADAAPAKS